MYTIFSLYFKSSFFFLFCSHCICSIVIFSTLSTRMGRGKRRETRGTVSVPSACLRDMLIFSHQPVLLCCIRPSWCGIEAHEGEVSWCFIAARDECRNTILLYTLGLGHKMMRGHQVATSTEICDASCACTVSITHVNLLMHININLLA